MRCIKTKKTRQLILSILVIVCAVFCAGVVSPDITTAYAETRQVVFVGDSRTVGMHTAIMGYEMEDICAEDSDSIWIGKISKGYSWFEGTAMPKAETYLKKGNTDLIILMGCNDMTSTAVAEDYVTYLEENESWLTADGNRVYFVSVNPVGHKNGDSTTEHGDFSNTGTCEPFNEILQEELPDYVTYIDTYSYLLEDGYSTGDGIHYNNDTYEKIYSYIRSFIGISETSQGTSAGTNVKAGSDKNQTDGYTLTVLAGEGVEVYQETAIYQLGQLVVLNVALEDGYENLTITGDKTKGSFLMPNQDVTVTVSASPVENPGNNQVRIVRSVMHQIFDGLNILEIVLLLGILVAGIAGIVFVCKRK